MKPKLKYILGLVIVAGAFAYLMITSFMGSFRYSLTPSEFMADQTKYGGKELKIAGLVEIGSVTSNLSHYQFTVTDEKHSIAVAYNGIAPATFKEGAGVVVTGRYSPAKETFEAIEIITKCSSKFETDEMAK